MMYILSLQFVAILLIASINVRAFEVIPDKIVSEDDAATIPAHTGEVSNLLEGSMFGDEDRVRKAIEDGEDIDVSNSNGWSAAHFAVTHGDLYVLEILIHASINLNAHADDGMTPLMLAAKQGDREMVEVMLKANADPTLLNDKNETALMLADSSGRKIVSLAIAEATVLFHLHNNEKDNEESESHSSHIVKGVQDGAYINIQSSAGWTPVIFASAKGHLKELTELVGLGGNVHHVETDGWSALHFAAHNGHTDTCEFLLKNKCNAKGTTYKGVTPLELAETAGHTSIVALLQQYMAMSDL